MGMSEKDRIGAAKSELQSWKSTISEMPEEKYVHMFSIMFGASKKTIRDWVEEIRF
jgi:hypothetical protein